MKNPRRIWVHDDFKRAIKKAAADSDKSVVDFTKDLAEDLKRQPDWRRKPRAFQ